MTTKEVMWELGTGEQVQKIRIFADRNKMISDNGVDFYLCADVDAVDGWYEVDRDYAENIMSEDDEAVEEDYINALKKVGILSE